MVGARELAALVTGDLSEPLEWFMVGWLPLGETGGLPFLKRRMAGAGEDVWREELGGAGGASGGFCRRVEVEVDEHADGGAIGLVSHGRRAQRSWGG